MRLLPSNPQAVVIDPASNKRLPAEGLELTLSSYWRRRLRDGSVIEAAAPSSAPAPAVEPASSASSSAPTTTPTVEPAAELETAAPATPSPATKRRGRGRRQGA